MIYNNFDLKKKDRGSIILIGNFDGVHLGHRKLFKLAKKFKKKYKLKIGVLTFEPLPKMFFNRKIRNFKISSCFSLRYLILLRPPISSKDSKLFKTSSLILRIDSWDFICSWIEFFWNSICWIEFFEAFIRLSYSVVSEFNLIFWLGDF